MPRVHSTICRLLTMCFALVVGVGAEVSPAASETAPSADVVVAGGLGARLDGVVKGAEAQGFHGVVLVAKGGEEVLVQGYGLANEASAARFTPSTVVQIGSGVKDFTKIAVLQLVEAGKLGLADPISRFFPQAPADKRAITVEQLLEHRAGLPLAIGRDEEPLAKAQFLERLFARPLEFAPGASKEYSNPGYALLAAIVEQLTGESFDAYVERAICKPAGLRETGLVIPHFDPARLAHGYEGKKDRGTMFDRPHSADGHDWNLRGNGGYVSTVREQLRFYRVLRGTTLLSDAAHRAMVINPDGPTVLAGSDMVCFFMFASYPGAGIEIILASNHAEWQAPRLLKLLEPELGLARPAGARLDVTGGPASAKLPDSGPGRTIAAYFEAFNSGDETQMRRFLEEHSESGPQSPPMDKRLENYRRMRDDLGRLTVRTVAETTMGLEITVEGEHGETATLHFQIEPVAPFRMRGLRVEVG